MLNTVFLTLSLAVSFTFAASSTGSAASSASTAVSIPSDVSSQCSTFLQAFDKDSQVQACLSPILSATSSFTSGSTPSSSQVSSALGSICASSTLSACSESMIRTQLTDFYSACGNELTGSNPEATVRGIYDMLYTLSPFLQSTCAKDDSDKYCVETLAAQSGVSSMAASSQQYLVSSGTGAPNATTFQTASIPFMFLTASTPKDTLCSTCAEAVLKPYVSFESSQAFAYGVTNSGFLGGQKALWNSVSSQCGTDFAAGVVANAGANPTDGVTSIGAVSGAVSVKTSIAGLAASLVGAFLIL